jgi:hypothetical protein
LSNGCTEICGGILLFVIVNSAVLQFELQRWPNVHTTTRFR